MPRAEERAVTGHQQELRDTRRSLHGVAELVLAGPQYARSGTIRLRPTPGGFGTVAEPSLRVVGVQVVGASAVDLDGRTPAEVSRELEVEPRSLADVYPGGSGVGLHEVLHVDAEAASVLAEAFAVGHRALSMFAPDTPIVLWPEHFDLGVAIDEVNYGLSPGDELLPEPYAYVGPWDASTLSDPFWNEPFGAARTLAELHDVNAFFEEGRSIVRKLAEVAAPSSTADLRKHRDSMTDTRTDI